MDVTFLALARDCEQTVRGLITLGQALESYGIRPRALVGEDSSRDGTRVALSDCPWIEIVDTSFMTTIVSRLERLAAGRACLASSLRQVSGVVCVADLDEPFLQSLDPRSFAACTERLMKGNVFAVSATSRPTYYDLLAFEDESRSFAGLDRQIQAIRNPLTYYRFFRDRVYPQQLSLTSDEDIYCTSAFNGVCLYRAEEYVLGNYRQRPDEQSLCEHVVFNRSVARLTGQRMVIDPTLVVPTPPEHGPRGTVGFFAQRLRKLPDCLSSRAKRDPHGGPPTRPP